MRPVSTLRRDTNPVREGDQARSFCAALESPVRAGIEATGAVVGPSNCWANWVASGGSATRETFKPRGQRTDQRDAQLLPRPPVEERFPRIWLPSIEERDVRQLLAHRSKMIGMRTTARNQLQALALGQGLRLTRLLLARRFPQTRSRHVTTHPIPH